MDIYQKFIFIHVPEMPNPEEDIRRFSGLHSWYKHLSDFHVAYPLLLPGQEKRNGVDPQITDTNPSNFHWRIIFEEDFVDYKIKIGEITMHIPDDIKTFMRKFPIYLNNKLGPSESSICSFQRTMCQKMCERFWEELIAIK